MHESCTVFREKHLILAFQRLYFLKINHLIRCSFCLRGSCTCSSCGNCTLIFSFALCFNSVLFAFVTDSNMFSQAVLVFKCLLAIIAFSWRLRRMLCSYMSPKIHRRNNKLTILTLCPFTISFLARFLLSF